ncbi:YeeE/YedE family protein [Nitrosomonas sp. sh817]|uniref:YeeE/YedE family protein n=1 Tax=Nitrosomonas sp. sh817 TaxID=3070658 RepID=UPI0027DBAFBF|nr:YeeE/YedE family protein [Nitrosomonas sp. sh817]WMJ09023.1 YeeE/YedE family protein [Nitrosomonas sp. sh817]
MNILLESVPWHAAAGGAVIGLAVAVLLLFNGRIAGISGIVGGLLRMPKGDIGWRVAFIAGLVLSVAIWKLFWILPEIKIEAGYGMLALAGLLVGYGTRLGSGCTSGHGVCGLSRRSPRSIAATVVFMTMGFATVYWMRHVWF